MLLAATTTSFVIASIILRASRKSEENGDLAAATAQMEAMKGKKSAVSGVLTDIEANAGGGRRGPRGGDPDQADPQDRVRL